MLARLAVHHELACLRNFALDAAENRSANLARALNSNRQARAAIVILMALHKLDQRSGVRPPARGQQHE